MKEKGKEKKDTRATKKTTVIKKKYWYPPMPMWTFILILILIGIFLGVALMGGTLVYRINKEVQATAETNSQQSVVMTYEEFKQEVLKLLKLNLPPEESKKEILELANELYDSSFEEWLKWVTDDEKWWLDAKGKTEESLVAEASDETGKPSVIEPGFNPDLNLIDISGEVNLPEIPKDSIVFKDYRVFPDVEGIWGKPRAGYNDGFNDEFSSSDRLRNVQIPTWKWLAFTGEEGWWPGVGSLKDPDGGAILLVVINVWEVPGEFTKAYLLHGFWAFGEVWDMSDMLDNGNNTAPKYGEYTLETMATIRNHYINQLGSTEPNPEFRGQTGKATQAETITWACVLRWPDGSFRLIGSGQWVRGQ